MRGRVSAIAAAIAAAISIVLPATVAGGESVARDGDEYTPVVQSVMSKPRWFRDSDARIHLVYELRLTNGFPVPVTVKSVSVRDAGRGETIERLRGSGLVEQMSLMATPADPETTIPPSANGVVWADVVVPSPRRIPARIRHRLVVSVPPGLPVPERIVSTGGSSRVDRRAPTRLDPPLRGAGWIAVGSCCDGPHRRSIQPVNGSLWLGQRFAIDWNGMNAENRWVVGDPSLNRSWVFYDKPVLAVADGRVIEAVDRYPDQTPGAPEPVTIEEADGNYVILRLSSGHFAFYAHLVPGSIRVEPGDVVRSGQVIGKLGNSGSSTGPHLHFQLMDRPSALASDGLPYVFDGFRRQGRIPPLTPELAALVEAGDPTPLEPVPPGPHRDELPLGRDVVAFPGGR